MPRTTATKTNIQRCALDLRKYGRDAYRLPTDGRAWRLLCSDRQRLATFLSMSANPDGTSITNGWASMAEYMGCSRAKVFRLLDDLKKLGLLTTDGKVSEYGTAYRSIHVEALAAKVSDTEPKSQIGDSPSLRLTQPESHVQKPKSQIAEPKSQLDEPESHPRRDPTVTEIQPPPPPYRTKAGEEVAILQEQTTDIAVELSKVRDFWRAKEGTELPESLRDTTELKKLIEQHGRKVFPAFKSFYDNGDWAGMNQPLFKFLAQFDKWVAGAAHDREAAAQQEHEQKDKTAREELSTVGGQVCHVLSRLMDGYKPANFLSSLPEEQRSRVTTLDATDYWERALKENVEFLWAMVKLKDVFEKNERNKEQALCDLVLDDLMEKSE